MASNLLDISRNNSVLTNAIDILLRKASFNTENEANKIFDKVDNLVDKIKNNSLFKKLGFKLFLNNNGNFKTPYSDEFFKESKNQFKNAKSKNSKESWEKYNNWKRKNEILFDVRKLFNNYYIKEDGNIFSENERNEHISELKSVIGEKRFNELYKRLEEKIKDYKENYELAVERYTEQESENIAEREALILKWEIENSPFKYVEFILENKQFKLFGEFVNPKGYDNTYEIPRKIDTEGNSTNWYDSKYQDIENDEDLYNFYRFSIDTIHDMYRFLPKEKIEKLTYNYLPEIKKSISEIYSEKGLQATMVGFYDKFIDSVTVDEDINDINLITNEKVNNIKVSMIYNKLKMKKNLQI